MDQRLEILVFYSSVTYNTSGYSVKCYFYTLSVKIPAILQQCCVWLWQGGWVYFPSPRNFTTAA